jgi:hypothetical protein
MVSLGLGLLIGVIAVMAAPLLPRSSALLAQDTDGILVHCVDVIFADPRFSMCQDQHPVLIQPAINHAESGEMVFVGAGSYPEQVRVTKPLTLEGAGDMLTAIRPAVVVANSSSLFSGAPIAAIVLVDGTTGVSVTDLTVDGFVAAFPSCSPSYVGIFYRASSGAIMDTHVTNIHEPGTAGCQGRLAIFVQSGNGGPGLNSSVTIRHNTVDVYGKNGITANEPGTFVTVTDNTVMGRGMTFFGDAAQNGVQIGFGARGLVADNVITNHFYVPEDFVACGLLFFRAGGGIGRTRTNTFAGNEQNICTAGVGPSPHSPFN